MVPRLLIRVPLYAAAAIAGLAVASTIWAKDYDEGSWQFWLTAFVILTFLCVFVMTPLLIVEQIVQGQKGEGSMKALVVTLVLPYEEDVKAAINDVAETVAQHYPMFAWDVRDATTDEVEWFRTEYKDESEDES